MIADQLANVGAPVSEIRLVLQLVTHLSDGYDGVATIIQQSDPLPPFYKARSMLTLEETRRAKTTESALVASSPDTTTDTNHSSSNNGGSHSRSKNNYNNSKGKGKNRYNNRGKGNNGGSQNNSSNGNGGGSRSSQTTTAPTGWTWVPLSPWQNPAPQGWTVPPCAYPTTGWTPGLSASRSQGILGPRPQHAFYAHLNATGMPSGALVPTDIATVMHNLSLQQPDDNLYMDTGASSHMMSNNGTLSSYSSLSNMRHIVVGNGHLIQIVGRGTMTLPSPHNSLVLKNVLHVPNIIKNLILVRQFTTDNSVSVEFDPFGFTVKDLKTGTPIMRSHSTGELYPLMPSTQPDPPIPQAFVTVPSTVWHARLGHPGSNIFNSLCKNKTISCSPNLLFVVRVS
ncbi:uncharacterized protein LOC141629172 [Silene latifolia]|uniref:uncharacterized protein LOC141629172 n=1 Tax=Silene latifolia TaxID=37657 RepID=UPI003D779A11